MPEDAAILDAARSGIEALNARLGDGQGDRFFLFHRARQWNPAEQTLDGLGAQARQARGAQPAPARRADTSFEVQVGDLASSASRSLLHHARLATRACRATRPGSSSASSRIR